MKIKCHILLDVEIEIDQDSKITDLQIKEAIDQLELDPAVFCDSINLIKISYLATNDFPAVSLPNEFKR